MATAINRDILNKEVNARFWLQTRHKIGKPLDPKNPLDKAKIPVWMDILRKVQAEANAGKLVITYDKPEVVQALADAQLASDVAVAHVDAAAKAKETDPATTQQHIAAATTAQQVVTIKAREGAASQPPTVSLQLEHEAAREAARTPPPPHAPAADQIAHAQMQARNGQAMLRPEDDPWDSRYVPKLPSEQPAARPPSRPVAARPARSPRERPSRDIINSEINARFWIRTNYKPHQRLDMAIPEDREMANVWRQIQREVEQEANAGPLALTDPTLIPPPSSAPSVAPSPPPREPPTIRPAPPSRSPRERPSRDVINSEINARFWVRTNYKPHQRLDMAIPEDQEMANVWMQIQREVEQEANAGRLTLTDPALIPPPSIAPPVAPSPSPPREPPPGRPPVRTEPSRSPRARPSRDVINSEINARFWIRTNYKPHQRLDMALPEDQVMANVWRQIQREVEQEVNADRLTLTDPALIPPPSIAPPPPPAPRPASPRPEARAPRGPATAPRPPIAPGQPPLVDAGPSRLPMDEAAQPSLSETTDQPTTEGAPEETSSPGRWIALSLAGLVIVGGAAYAISRSQGSSARRLRGSRAEASSDRDPLVDSSFSFPSHRRRP